MSGQTGSERPGTIVLSAPRSGTTLLRRLLDAHPAISCPPDINVSTQCARMLREEPVNGGLRMGMVSGLWFAGMDEASVIERVRRFATEINDEICFAAAKEQWVEKSYFHGFLIDELELLYGEHCRYLCIVRHGLDVAYSMSEHCARIGSYPGELHPYIQRYNRPMLAFANAWADTMGRMRRFLDDHADVALLVRYEDLVTDPVREFERVLEFLGAETGSSVDRIVDQALESVGSVGFGDWKTYQRIGLDPGSIGRWRSEDRETLRPMASVVNPELVAYGYDPVEVARPLTGEQIKRRLRLGLESSWMQASRGGTS